MLLNIAAVGLDRDRPPGIAGRLSRRPLRRGEVDIRSRHRRTGLGHRERNGAADPGAGARHQHDLILQNRHILPPTHSASHRAYTTRLGAAALLSALPPFAAHAPRDHRDSRASMLRN